jgi:eukaryotic-like serine/threonine-protein kinase
MDKEKWQEISRIFNSALEKTPVDRKNFIAKVCGDDENLRREIENLLNAHESEDSFIDAEISTEISSLDLKKGDMLASFEIEKLLGKGGMGEVYLARDTRLNRSVALKILPPANASDPNANKRLLREAQAAAGIEHPHICTIHEIGESKGNSFIVMQYVEGNTLSECLKQQKLSDSESVMIVIQITEALSEAHTRGIVHRDIKPANIVISTNNQVKILDFGLAKHTENEVDSGRKEQTLLSCPGLILGTASYMSPEQARGELVDGRSDLWSLGVCLYEMTTGKLPFTGSSTVEKFVAILHNEPDFPEHFNDQLWQIVRKLLTKDTEKRYRSAGDLLIDLKDLQRQLDIRGEPEHSVGQSSEPRNSSSENETQVFTEPTRGGQTAMTQDVTNSFSGLEYAVTQAKRHKFTAVISCVFLVAVMSAVGYFGFLSKGNGSARISSIAVMPFVNDSGNPDTEFLSDGMTETLIGSLSRIPNLSVKARSSVFRYKGKDTSAQIIAKELNVQSILNGRVVQRGDQLILSLELVDVSTENVLWSQQYTRKQTDLILLQSEIAGDVSSNLKSKLSGTEAAQIAKSHTTNPEAYQLYLKGRFNWNRRTTVFLKQAVDFFKQAIEKDPNYAQAYSGLAETYVLFPSWGVASSKESMPLAKAAALRALELDDSLAEAHAALGAYLAEYEYDRVGGENHYRRAIELNPNYATARQWFALDILAASKRFDEALAELRLAQEFDPLSPVIATNLGDTLVYARRYDEAILQYKRTLTLDPNFAYAHYALGWVYGLKGMYSEAVAETRKSVELNNDPTAKGYLGLWLAKSGGRKESLKLLDELNRESADGYVPDYAFALIYIGLNEKEEALNRLEKVVTDRTPILVYYAVGPELDDLRGEPRFKDMLKRMNLPE